MIKMRITIWFRKTLINEAVIKGLNSACSLLKLDVNFMIKGQSKPATIQVWDEIYNSFKPYEYTGIVNWIMNGESGQIKGKIYWPIHNPANLPGSVQFDISWENKKQTKGKGSSYVFDDVELLLNFLHMLSASVSADRLLVEPVKLPPDMIDLRYERFRKLTNNKTLTNIDWIFGIRTSDKQSQDFKEIMNIIHKRTEVDGFVIYALTPNPLSYKSEEEIEFIKNIEEKIGLS